MRRRVRVVDEGEAMLLGRRQGESDTESFKTENRAVRLKSPGADYMGMKRDINIVYGKMFTPGRMYL